MMVSAATDGRRKKVKKLILMLTLGAALSADQSTIFRPGPDTKAPIYTLTPEGRIFVDGRELKGELQITHALSRLVAAMAKYPLCGGAWPAGHKPEPMDIHWQIEEVR